MDNIVLSKPHTTKFYPEVTKRLFNEKLRPSFKVLSAPTKLGLVLMLGPLTQRRTRCTISSARKFDGGFT